MEDLLSLALLGLCFFGSRKLFCQKAIRTLFHQTTTSIRSLTRCRFLCLSSVLFVVETQNKALASSLVGTLASAEMLRAAGVGDESASAVGAALSFVVGELVGHVARILFAWRHAGALDAFSKQFRLFADCCNDAALLAGLLASRRLFLLALCLQSLLRALVGVAGAATRAAVVVHQARGGGWREMRER